MSELNIPETWAETEVGNAITLMNGFAFKSNEFKDNGVPVIRISNIQDGVVDLNETKCIDEKPEFDRFSILKGDLLVAMSGATTGKMGVYLTGEKAYLNQRVGNLKVNSEEHIDLGYRNFFFKNVSGEILEKAYGGAQPNISGKMIEEISMPIPPKGEQKRIVQKIESCFEKIDETEQNLNKVEVLLEKYRESLLAKAFRGELIPQNPDDEPASVLLSKIREEREKAESGKKSKVQAFAPIEDVEKPFEIPESWEWVRLGELDVITGNTPKKMPKTTNDVPFFKPADFAYTGNIFVSKSEDSSSSTYKYREVKKNSVVLVCIGATLGKTGIVTKDGAFNQQQNAVLPSDYVLPEYLCYWFRSSAFQKNLWRINSSTTMPIVNKGQMETLLFPLCSLEEQKRIITKIQDSLSKVHNTLSSVSTQKKVLSLAKDSILTKAFEGRLVEQIESEGTGHELLEKILVKKNAEAVTKEDKKTVKRKVSAKKVTKKKITKKKV